MTGPRILTFNKDKGFIPVRIYSNEFKKNIGVLMVFNLRKEDLHEKDGEKIYKPYEIRKKYNLNDLNTMIQFRNSASIDAMIEELYKLKGALVEENPKGILTDFNFVIRNRNEASIADGSPQGIHGKDAYNSSETIPRDSETQS